jgi:hypothetical protein
MWLPRPTLPADRRHGRLDAAVGAGDVHREVAPHRVTVHAEPLRIDLALPFKKRQAATATEGEQIPVVVLGMLTVVVELQRPGQQRAVALHVALRRIDRSPIGVGIAVFRALDGVERSRAAAAAAPVHREARVAAGHEQLHLGKRASLPAPMDVHHTRHRAGGVGAFGKPVDRGHPRGHALERADEVANVAVDAAVLAPLADHLRLERIAARIEVGPQFGDRPRHVRRGLRGCRTACRQQRRQQDPQGSHRACHLASRLHVPVSCRG